MKMTRPALLTPLSLALFNIGLLFTPPALSAESVFLRYGPLEFSLKVESLRRYAQGEPATSELAVFIKQLSPEEQDQLREILRTRAEVDVVAVSQFLYSTQGEAILKLLGRALQTRQGQSGFYALRSALILAAASEEGLTPVNVLDQFPTQEILINSAFAFDLLNQVSQTIEQTEKAIAVIEQKSQTQSKGDSFRRFPFDLRQNARFPYTKQTLVFNDIPRRRVFLSDVYLPQVVEEYQFPLVIISHGLGSNRQTYQYLAEHLASHGFAVALPEHPGSNAEQLEALSRGFARDISPPQEFLDRPLDIEFLLNQLERTYSDRINTQQVGVVGQSFGGYTALALGGASLNFAQLQQGCTPDSLTYSLNLSLLLQCPASSISTENVNFRDERITAVLAINPVTSQIFGDNLQEIQIPVMIVTSSADTVALPLAEQILPFTTLTTPDKYLVLLKQGTHFSTLGGSESDVPLPTQVVGPDPAIAQNYTKALSLAFFGTHLLPEKPYQDYLSTAYTNTISDQKMPLTLIKMLSPDQLKSE